MDGVQLPQGYRGTMRRQFTFYYQVPRNSWYSFDQTWSHPVVLNSSTMDWESSTFTTKHSCAFFFFYIFIFQIIPCISHMPFFVALFVFLIINFLNYFIIIIIILFIIIFLNNYFIFFCCSIIVFGISFNISIINNVFYYHSCPFLFT